MKIELHCHTTMSDGLWTPTQLVNQAEACGIEVLTITDHDTCDAYAEARKATRNVQLIQGVELSCIAFGKKLHLLVYGNKASDWSLLEPVMAEAQRQRSERLQQICNTLSNKGLFLSMEEVLNTAGGVAGRPHIAEVMVKKGYARNTRDAFSRYLSDAKLGALADYGVDIERALGVVDQLGLRASLAHPHSFSGDVSALFRKYRSLGLEGIEARWGRYTKKQAKSWMQIATQYDLVVTGGSDNHGRKEDIPLGIDWSGLECERLCSWLDL